MVSDIQDDSKFQLPVIGIGIEIGIGIGYVPNSQFQCTLAWCQVRYSQEDDSKSPRRRFQIPNTLELELEIGMATFQIPFYCIPLWFLVIVTNLFMLLFYLSSIPIPRWVEWNGGISV